MAIKFPFWRLVPPPWECFWTEPCEEYPGEWTGATERWSLYTIDKKEGEACFKGEYGGDYDLYIRKPITTWPKFNYEHWFLQFWFNMLKGTYQYGVAIPMNAAVQIDAPNGEWLRLMFAVEEGNKTYNVILASHVHRQGGKANIPMKEWHHFAVENDEEKGLSFIYVDGEKPEVNRNFGVICEPPYRIMLWISGHAGAITLYLIDIIRFCNAIVMET